jgi:predicted ester cyclase
MMGMPATGKKILGRGMDMLRFENGKIAETWNFPDEMGMCVQIGRFPEIK